jgi:hypothetical protein
MYHAQYRVLEAFSILNLILGACSRNLSVETQQFIYTFIVVGFLIFLFFLAIRQHRRGYRKVWLYPVPIYPWFQGKNAGVYAHQSSMRNKELPKPVTAKDAGTRRQPSTRRPNEKAAGAATGAQTTEKRRSAFWVWVERPRLAHTRDRTFDRERERAAERERERERERQRQLDREREQERERTRERIRAQARERQLERERSSRSNRDRLLDRERSTRSNRDRDRLLERERSTRERDRQLDRERSTRSNRERERPQEARRPTEPTTTRHGPDRTQSARRPSTRRPTEQPGPRRTQTTPHTSRR